MASIAYGPEDGSEGRSCVRGLGGRSAGQPVEETERNWSWAPGVAVELEATAASGLSVGCLWAASGLGFVISPSTLSPDFARLVAPIGPMGALASPVFRIAHVPALLMT